MEENQSFRLETEVESLENIPENLKGIYVKNEETGKFSVCKEIGGTFSGMKGTIEKLRAERDSSNRMAAEAHSKLEEISSKNDASNEISISKAKKTTEQTDQVKVLQDKLESLTTMLKEKEEFASKSALENSISKALNKNGATELLTPHVKSNLKVKYEDGSYVVNVVEGGQIRYSSDGTRPMTVDEYVLEMKSNPTFQPAFKASGVTGSGMKVRQNQSVATPKDKAKMTLEERGQAILAKHGLL